MSLAGDYLAYERDERRRIARRLRFIGLAIVACKSALVVLGVAFLALQVTRLL